MSVDERSDSDRSASLKSYDDLQRAGANIDPTFQQVINFRFVKRVDSYNAVGDGPHLDAAVQRLTSKRGQYPKNAGICSGDIVDEVIQERNAKFDEVELLRVKAISYYSFLVASSAAYGAANRFLSDLGSPDVAALIK
ncbi:hypothetical protein FJV76_08940 [Mesorhizobium sp. WSM4303]|uniref:hypothetical protein n=1 Tax=unclassified Mesorhizobium TaxID=325217 RepID=UPI00115EC23B|nr:MULTISPECIES: hypothetical protein [unclassified Mesorhizobium]TRC99743.1 hypothetical protein FJV77_04810 [Mesorhizobium sp. WSM4306]TRD05995.1 hypothetical protein FJV76_08940 [Mesorhizobium sp. WSM4303]